MKRFSALLLLYFSPFVFFGQTIGPIYFSSESTLEIVSWNLEWFPKNGQSTIQYVAAIIEALDPDVIACQEIGDQAAFNNLLNRLPAYSGYYATSGGGLAYLYHNHRVDINDFYEIYRSGNSGPFPRPPLVMDFNFQNKHFIVINNHLKCCGDGFLNLSDGWDEENRRLQAVDLLKNYTELFFEHQNVFIVGDFNDEITDPYQHNVFRNVLDDKDNYLFSDIGIANGNPENWSYPSWPSHLDHILITNELFTSLDNDASLVEALRIDDLMDGGWDEYDENVSDHRPVAIRLLLPANLSVTDQTKTKPILKALPNPFTGSTNIHLPSSQHDGLLEISDLQGRLVKRIEIPASQTKYATETDLLSPGCYLVSYTNQAFSQPFTILLVKK